MAKVRVGVLMGGKSQEHEVSFNSGRTVCDHLDNELYHIIPIFQTAANKLFILPWRFLHRGKTTDFEHRLLQEAQEIAWDDLKNLVDFVYIALHGRFAEDGTVQGFLEILKIPYLGSKVFASALSMDKIFQKKLLHAQGIDIPKDIYIQHQQIIHYSSEYLASLLKLHNLSFPLIVKPHKEGSSIGVSLVESIDQLIPALHKASTCHPHLIQDVLIEEYIEGMEFSCIILTDKTNKPLALPPTQIVSNSERKFFDYEQKYMPGKAIQFTPARCSQEQQKIIQSTCIKVMHLLRMTNLARIDGFLTQENKIVIIDPNSLSGMGPASFLFKQAAEINMSHTMLINHLIETELNSYGISIGMNKQHYVNNNARLKVAVLLGGRSNEKEISLESGRNVIYKLSPVKYEAIPLFVNKDCELYTINERILTSSSTQEIEKQLTPSMYVKWHNLPSIADFVFNALHGGEGENGSVQGTLEMLGLPYNGSSILASALCMDKHATNSFLQTQGFDVPQSVFVERQAWQDSEIVINTIKQTLLFPLIVKPHDDGCSVLVSRVNNEHELYNHLDSIFGSNKSGALVEEYIRGMELTVGVVGNDEPYALPPSWSRSVGAILSIEEKFLPGSGENQTPAPLSESALSLVKKTMTNVYKAVGCKGYARIDCFYQNNEQSPTGNERVVILEINTLPALTPATCIFHQAAELGLKPMEFIDRIIQLGLELHQKVPAIATSPESEVLKNSAL